MSVKVLEHDVRRAGLALLLSDLATGATVFDGILATSWPVARPDLAVSVSPSASGVAGWPRLPGLLRYEDGSTPRDAWFASPVQHAPLAFGVRVVDSTRRYLRVVQEVLVPSQRPVAIALPRSPAAAPPSGSLVATATVVTEAGAPASWAVVDVTVGGVVSGGICDERGLVVIPIPRSVPASGAGTPSLGPVWHATTRVRYRPAGHVTVPGSHPDDPPSLASLLVQAPALVQDADGALHADVQRDLTSAGPLVVSSRPLPAPSVLVVRPAP
jgi:hypothetical protein